MKQYLNKIGMATLAALLLAACTPDSYDGPNAGDQPVAANYADKVSIKVDPEERYVYFHFDAPAGVTPMWFINDGEYASQKFYSGNITYKKFYGRPGHHNVEVRVKNASGISSDVLTREFDMVIAEPQWVAVDDADNLWSVTRNRWDGVKGQCAITEGNRSYTFTLPQATTTTNQYLLTFYTGIDLKTVDLSQEYDVLILMESSETFTARVKVYDGSDGNNYFTIVGDRDTEYFEADLKAGETTRFFIRQATAKQALKSNLRLRFDFAGNPANTTITIKDIIFQKHVK